MSEVDMTAAGLWFAFRGRELLLHDAAHEQEKEPA